MDTHGLSPHLVEAAAKETRAWLQTVAAGSALPLEPVPELSFVLELLLPEVLLRNHPEWRDESIDGFYFSSATKSDETSAELVGTCILITDQRVTPFALDLTLATTGELDTVRVRLGEPGAGALGISGPECNSLEASHMLLVMNDRLPRIQWVYDVSL